MRIPVAKPSISQEEIAQVMETLKSGWISQGPKTERFEKEFARYCDAEYGIAVNSGTSALHLVLSALEIGPGDEVITTSLSCIATGNAILYTGAKPVFCDIDPHTLNIDPDQIEKAITEDTKAIIPVHLLGQPADMDRILEISEEHQIPIIEDASQAQGAKYKGRKVGSIGDYACFSLYTNKIITTGEGGMILTDNKEMTQKMRLLRNHGQHQHKKFFHPWVGYNYKMTDLNASIGLAQLGRIDDFISRKRRNVALLNEELSENREVASLPREEEYSFHVYFSYYILLQNSSLKNQIVKNLEEKGVETRPLFSVIPQQPPYQDPLENPNKDYTNAIDAHSRGFYVTNSPELTENELTYLKNILSETIKRTK